MKGNKILPDKTGRKFNGKLHLNIKRIRTEPRQRIRQLLRSFIPLAQFLHTKKPDQKKPD